MIRATLKTVLAAAALSLSAAACAQEPGEYVVPAGPDDAPQGLAHAVFASGCFWCTEADFEKLDGVVEVVSGFAGGEEENPGYYQVVRGETGHAEAARIIFDPAQISYGDLLDHYWVNVDPFDARGQFCDRGAHYAPYIFPVDADQAEEARRSLARIQDELNGAVVVQIEALDMFWPAEGYHQDYAETNPIRYQRYRFGCRRDQRLREVWGARALGG